MERPMKSTRSHPISRHSRAPLGGARRKALVVLAALAPVVGLLVVAQPASSALSPDQGTRAAVTTTGHDDHADHKSYVCKYVGTPGVDERLQSGQNPIWVDNHALTGKDDSIVKVGDTFSDKHGKSVVVVANTPKLTPEPKSDICPLPVGPIHVTVAPPTATPPTCTTDGALVVPTVQGITYKVLPKGTGPGTYYWLATADKGYVIDGAHWGSVTVKKHLTGDHCLVVPVAPTTNAPTCSSPTTVTLPTTPENVVYNQRTEDGVITVTAVPAAGYSFDGESQKVVTTIDVLPALACVAPVPPTVVLSTTCGVEGSYTIPTTTGISYLLTGTTIAAGTYPGPASGTVTAVATTGYVLTTPGWSVALSVPAAAPCAQAVITVVTPVDPTVAASTTCEVQGSYTIPATTGITYRLGGEIVKAGPYVGPASGTVTAEANPGYTLSTTGWSFTLTVAAPAICPEAAAPAVEAPATGTTATTTTTTAALPKTGAPVATLGITGVLALLLGLALIAVGTRRPVRDLS
jgi:hypothetical protein